MLIQNISSNASALAPVGDSAPPAYIAAPPTTTKAVAEPHETQPVQPTATQLQNAVDSVNKSMKQASSSLEFSIDKDTQKTVIKVVESKTGDVIRQFPSEEMLAIARAIEQMQQKGLLLKQKA